MILLLCANESDTETESIVSWLNRWHAPFLKLYSESLLFDEFTIENEYFELKGRRYKYNSFSTVYLSRWFFKNPALYRNDDYSFHSNIDINIMLNEEWKSYCRYFFSKFKRASWVSNPQGYFLDKLEQLQIAKNAGLSVPKTVLTTHIGNQYDFSEWITKPITNMGYLVSRDHTKVFSAYTTGIDSLQEGFEKEAYFPSLIQKKTSFDYEIRCHYIDGEIYAAGLIPVSHNEEENDIKKIQYRVSPVQLSEEVKDQLTAFMIEIEMKVGFIDVLFHSGKYTFLELNPIGKYAFYSRKCGFNIDHKIAHLVLKHHEKGKEKNSAVLPLN